MIKVLHCLESIAFGGVERRRLSIVKKLDKTQFEHKIICTKAHPDFKKKFEELGVEVFEVGEMKSPFDWSIHKKVQKVIKAYRPDILHGAVFEGVSMAAINGAFCNVKSIILEETSDPVDRSKKATLLLKFYAKVADVFVGVSPISFEYLKNNVTAKKAYLINNGVKEPNYISDEEKFNLRNELGIKESDFVIGTVGRMLDDNHKRFSDVIKAASILKEKKVDLKFLMVGGGKLLEFYQNLVTQLNLKEYFIFPGRQMNIDLYYSIMDLFVIPSAYEAFGLVVAEAMFHELPVIGTKVGGIQYIIKDNETGYLIPSKNPEAIAEKILEFYQHPDKAMSMGKKGFERVVSHFSEDVYTENVALLYNNLSSKSTK